MANVTVDLTDALRQLEVESQLVLEHRVMPWVVGELHAKWPRDTGRSAESWRFDGGNLTNSAPYTEYIRQGAGLATSTVLDPIITQAATRAWTE